MLVLSRRIEALQLAPGEWRHEPAHRQLVGCREAAEFEGDQPPDRSLERAMPTSAAAETDLAGRVLEVQIQPTRADFERAGDVAQEP